MSDSLVSIIVPCYNAEAYVGDAIESALAQTYPHIEVIVIDDGSTDRTIEVARAHGVTHIVKHTRNMGLARSFADGVEYALAHGADIVVNTDGDNQYPQERIPDLVAPILEGRADIVIGDRQTATIPHFSRSKKFLQRTGSAVVNAAASTELPDAASGFRAYSKHALFNLNVVTQFSYCMETIIQAGNKRLRIESVPAPISRTVRSPTWWWMSKGSWTWPVSTASTPAWANAFSACDPPRVRPCIRVPASTSG